VDGKIHGLDERGLHAFMIPLRGYQACARDNNVMDGYDFFFLAKYPVLVVSFCGGDEVVGEGEKR
jgi:hypothetical protein